MSITNEKLQTIKDNVSKVYRSGQMDVIKNANSLKGFESSKAILLDDVSPVEHDMEVRVRGKNLLPYPFIYETFDSHGITFTDNKDGTITLKGKNDGTDISNYNLFNTSDKLSFLKPNTDYYLSCNLDNIIKSLRTAKSDGTYEYYSYGNINFPPDETPDRLFIQIRTTDTTIYNNTVVKLQIELGTTATDYEPYNNDIQNVHSKNLLPFPYTGLQNVGVTEETNGVNFTLNEDGSVLIDGTASTGTVKYIYQNTKDLLGLKSGDVITGSKYVSDSSQLSNFNLTFNYYDSTTKMKDGMTLGSITNKTITITDDYIGWGIYIYIPSGKTISNLLVKPQLELGSTATYYEKYHEPYPLVVKRCGKNLFDADMSFTNDNKVTDGAATGYLTYFIQLQPNTKYYAKCFNPITTDITVTILSSNKAVNSDVGKGILLSRQLAGWKTELALTTDDTGRLYVGNNANNLNLIKEVLSACNLQIELGTTATDYEPYVTPTEYTPNADGVINGIKNLYPNTTLISNGDRVYIDCNYYKDIDKAYNKLSAKIALSGGE